MGKKGEGDGVGESERVAMGGSWGKENVGGGVVGEGWGVNRGKR